MRQPSVALFSYGTLQKREVQLANYGRLLEGLPDVLTGYRLESIAIADPDVVEVSGLAVHAIARPTGNSIDRIDGMLFLITEDELAATDEYESAHYARVGVVLESGRAAYVYVAP